MNPIFPILARALSPFRSRVALAALAVAALLPLSAGATNPDWWFNGGVWATSINNYLYDPVNNPDNTTVPGYGPSVNFEQDLVIYADGSVDVDCYLNGNHTTPGPYSISDLSIPSFPGDGDYYCHILINYGSVTNPLLDGNGDPYIELYDGSTGDGYQPNPWYNMDGSYSDTLNSSNNLTASFSGIIHFNGDPGWSGNVTWLVELYAQ